MQQICDDLEAETGALAEILTGLSEQQWRLPTPAEGWDTRDTIAHLAAGGLLYRLAVQDRDRFLELKPKLLEEDFDMIVEAGADMGSMTGAELWEWFDAEQTAMITAFRGVDPKDRIPWVGPDMSARSLGTAWLMETWSHGCDIADAHGAAWTATDRLRNIAHLGVTTRVWNYQSRGLEIPQGEVRVELVAPGGEIWSWGPADAESQVSGSALEFCLLVTQRRHRSELALQASGTAGSWLDIAQCYAGHVTDTRPPNETTKR